MMGSNRKRYLIGGLIVGLLMGSIYAWAASAGRTSEPFSSVTIPYWQSPGAQAAKDMYGIEGSTASSWVGSVDELLGDNDISDFYDSSETAIFNGINSTSDGSYFDTPTSASGIINSWFRVGDTDQYVAFRAGATEDYRSYFAWYPYTENVHAWLMGRNASDHFILFGTTETGHRFQADSDGTTYLSSVNDKPLILQRHTDTFSGSRVAINRATAEGTLHIQPDVASDNVLVIWGADSQTGDLTRWTDSSSSTVLAIKADGDILTDRWQGTNGNTAIGIGVMGSNALSSGGTLNTAYGSDALKDISTGDSNMAIGSSALADVSTGSHNLGIGYKAGYLVTGDYNTLIGSQAGDAVVGGSQNVAIGYNSLSVNAEGDYNVAIGSNSLLATTGGSNIALGRRAGHNITTGAGNIIFGENVVAASITGDHQLKIGFSTTNVAIESATMGSDLTLYGVTSVPSGMGELYYIPQTSEATTTEGTVAYADSTNWNPGSGKGLYVYTGAAWEKLH